MTGSGSRVRFIRLFSPPVPSETSLAPDWPWADGLTSPTLCICLQYGTSIGASGRVASSWWQVCERKPGSSGFVAVCPVSCLPSETSAAPLSLERLRALIDDLFDRGQLCMAQSDVPGICRVELIGHNATVSLAGVVPSSVERPTHGSGDAVLALRQPHSRGRSVAPLRVSVVWSEGTRWHGRSRVFGSVLPTLSGSFVLTHGRFSEWGGHRSSASVTF